MNEIERKLDDLNMAIVKAQGELMDMALLLDKYGIDRTVLNKIRNALADAEYESRNVIGIKPDIEIY